MEGGWKAGKKGGRVEGREGGGWKGGGWNGGMEVRRAREGGKGEDRLEEGKC